MKEKDAQDLDHSLRHWLYDFANQGIILTTKDLVVSGWNQWMEIHSGRSMGDVIDQSLTDLYPDLIRRRMDGWYRKALEGQVVILSQRFHHYLISLPISLSHGPFKQMQQTVRIAPLIFNGKVNGTITLIEDVTERVLREHELKHLNLDLEKKVKERTDELVRAQETLMQSQKMEAIGRLAGGVAHDFNNLLTGILGIGEDLKTTLSLDDARRGEVEEIIQASHRAFGLTRQLLQFGRRQYNKPETHNLNAIVLEMSKLLGRLIGENIRLDLQLSDIHSIKIDRGQLEQVIVNLVVNARDAIPGYGTITLRTDKRDLNQRRGPTLELPAGAYTVLEVIDTGTGMDAETLSKIFEPFFSTKRDKGTGLGLATVHGIVKQAGGDIRVQSAPGEGSHFTIFLPVSHEPVFTARTPPAIQANSGDEGILVLEDEEIVRRVVVRKLEKAGYRVFAAANAKEALALGKKHCTDVRLFITDVVMPDQSGPEVAQELRKPYPDLAVLYISGYAESIVTHKGGLSTDIDFLEKSAISAGLLAKVREVLARKPHPAPKVSAAH